MSAIRCSFVPLVALAALLRVTAPALAQGGPSPAPGERREETRSFQDGQGRLIAYYSAALTFTSVAAPLRQRPWTVEPGLELAYIPELSASRRSVGDKPEASNLTPVAPRPRVAVALPGGVRAEGSWIPPVRAFGVKANVVAAALSRPVYTRGALVVTPRVAAMTGTIRGTITCYDDLEHGNAAQQEYYTYICYGHESDDMFKPRQLVGEVIAARQSAGFAPYAGVGVRDDRTKFDIGVLKPDGSGGRSRNLDEPILDLRVTRPHVFAGATWAPGALVRTTAELFYAPGSVFTIRVQGSLRLHAGP